MKRRILWICLAFLMLGTLVAWQWSAYYLAQAEKRISLQFKNDSQILFKNIQKELDGQLQAIDFLHTSLSFIPHIHRQNFNLLGQQLQHYVPFIQWVAWLQPVTQQQVRGFEFERKVEGIQDYTIFELLKVNQHLIKMAASKKNEYYPISYVVPQKEESILSGLNLTAITFPYEYGLLQTTLSQKQRQISWPVTFLNSHSKAKTLLVFAPVASQFKPQNLKGVLLVSTNFDLFLKYLRTKYAVSPLVNIQLVDEITQQAFFNFRETKLEPTGFDVVNKVAEHHFKLGERSLVIHLSANLLQLYPHSEFSQERNSYVLFWKIEFWIVLLTLLMGFVLLKRQQAHVLLQKISEDEALFSTLFSVTQEGIMILKNRKVIDINRAALETFMVEKKDDILNQLPDNWFPYDQPDGQKSSDKWEYLLNTCFALGTVKTEWMMGKNMQAKKWFDVVFTLVCSGGDETVHISWHDVTNLKNLQKQYLQAREEAEASSEAKSRLLGNLSHELKTPIHGILSYAQLGEGRIHRIDKKTAKRYFHNIYTSGERLRVLLNDMLTAVKLEAGQVKLSYERVSFTQLVEQCIEMQRAALEEKEIHIVFEPRDPYWAQIDQGKMMQVLINLFNNAIKFSPKHSQLTLKIMTRQYEVFEAGHSAYQEMVAFSIEDEGPGIPNHELEKIFNQFEQSSAVAEGSSGTGLGLTICKEIIYLHQGKIWAKNSLKQGAIFTFMIPIYPPKKTETADEQT